MHSARWMEPNSGLGQAITVVIFISDAPFIVKRMTVRHEGAKECL